MVVGAGGGVRTSRSVSLKHMVPTHKTTLLASNCPGIDVIPVCDWHSGGLCVCQYFHRSFHSQPLTFSLFFFFLPVRACSQPVTWTPLNGESARSWISCPRDFRKHRSHTWSYFRKSFYFKEEVGEGVFALCCSSAVVGAVIVWWFALQSNSRKPVPVHASAGHHEPREPEPEVCYFDSTSGFMCLSIGVWRRALHVCWR